MIALLTFTVGAEAMSYSQAREQALFLTDKMAYELNLTDAQYEAAYEVNLDYLMSINTYDDLYGPYWRSRNLDLSYILIDRQYKAFCAASYFFRPLCWQSGAWHFTIYARYPHRSHFYFGRPACYATYRGGHGWRATGGRSWYRGRDFNHGLIAKGHGMKDRFDRGDFNRKHNNDFNRRSDRDFNRGNNSRQDFNRPSRQDKDRPFRFTPVEDKKNNVVAQNSRPDNNRINFGGSRSDYKTSGNTLRQNRNDNRQDRSENRRSWTEGRTTRNEGRINRESSTRTTVRSQRGGFSQGNSVQRTLPAQPRNTFTPSRSSTSRQSVRQASSRPSGNSGNANRGNGGAHFGGRR